MRKFLFFIFIFWAIAHIAVADEAAPSLLPHVKPFMRSAAFWIVRHPSADKIVMTEPQIKSFNDNIKGHLRLTKDIFSLVNHFQTESLMDVFKKNMEDYSNKGYYLADGTQEDSNFLEKIKKNMHLSAVVLGVEPRYGLLMHFANQKFFPTREGLYAQKGDVDFDELQNSGLDIGSAAAVVHTSLDGKWYYVLSALSDGWVEAEKIVLGDTQQIKNFVQAKDFVIVTGPKAEIFLDAGMNNFYELAKMGVKFPFVQENETQWIVQIPLKDKEGKMVFEQGYIPKAQAHRGYLPYTARSIYNQAFLMLDKPYGWGDMNTEQDCSRFLQMVYATVGLELPRDSRNQAQVGVELASFDEKALNKEKLDVLQNTLGALTILPMKGHIMLYLGMADGLPFAIHETSGYSQTQIESPMRGEEQVKYVLNRVVVSDLSLGENSKKGSLLRRLSKVVGIQ